MNKGFFNYELSSLYRLYFWIMKLKYSSKNNYYVPIVRNIS